LTKPPGGPTAAVIALKNPQITVHVADLDANRIQKWNSKHLPVYEPGLLDVVRLARDGVPDTAEAPCDAPNARLPNLFFTTNVKESVEDADLILMSVNTPTKISGIGAGSATNLISLEGAMTSIAQWAKPGAIIVEKSTVPCRTAQMLRRIVSRLVLVLHKLILIIVQSLISIAQACLSRFFQTQNSWPRAQQSRIC
jgi:UDPglucose 6-dehydrogenase